MGRYNARSATLDLQSALAEQAPVSFWMYNRSRLVGYDEESLDLRGPTKEAEYTRSKKHTEMTWNKYTLYGPGTVRSVISDCDHDGIPCWVL